MAALAVLAERGGLLSGPHAFTEAVLAAISTAEWPDGSPLVDVAPEVLRDRLAPRILEAAFSLAAISSVTAGGAR